MTFIKLNGYVSHELIKEFSVEYRDYQIEAATKAIHKNTLIILPTGTGKTIIALLSSIEWIKNTDGKIIMITPTKPLVAQHTQLFIEKTKISKNDIIGFTGDTRPIDRRALWAKKIIVATPQVIYNDLINGIIKPNNKWLIIFDEAHKAVKEHPYVKVARIIYNICQPRIIGLTASPGDIDRTREIMANLFLEDIIILTRKDESLRKYLQPIKMKILECTPPEPLKYALNLVNESIKSRIEKLKTNIGRSIDGVNKISPKSISFTKLDELRIKIENKHINGEIDKYSRNLLKTIILELIILEKLLTHLESYSYDTFLNYIEKIKKKALRGSIVEKSILNDPKLHEAYIIVKTLSDNGLRHPKIDKLIDFIKNNRKKTIVFIGLKDLILSLANHLENNGINTLYLIGQPKDKNSLGMKQHEQIYTLKKFREPNYNVLLATHIGEEGLDISEVENVVFYDNPISAIRRIQREGRTGRTRPGNIYFIVLKGTRDEARYWAGKRRENLLIKNLINMGPTIIKIEDKNIKPLTDYMKEKEVSNGQEFIPIMIDYREQTGKIIEYLKKRNIRIELVDLKIGDYLIGDYLIERKTCEDLAKSIIDGRLFKQLKNLSQVDNKINKYIIIEGSLSEFTKILNINNYSGIIMTILDDFNIKIIRTQNKMETAEFLYNIYVRSTQKRKGIFKTRLEKKPLSLYEIQRFVLSGIPGIDTILADRLLKRFGTLSKIANANINELTKVPGIGTQLAKKIFEVFHSHYDINH